MPGEFLAGKPPQNDARAPDRTRYPPPARDRLSGRTGRCAMIATRILDLDDTTNCPLDSCCATCGTEDDLAVGTAVTPVGVHCVTLCGSCAEKGDVRCASWPAAMASVLDHCEHLDCDLDEMAAALHTTEPGR